jgi:hypothetical protein
MMGAKDEEAYLLEKAVEKDGEEEVKDELHVVEDEYLEVDHDIYCLLSFFCLKSCFFLFRSTT